MSRDSPPSLLSLEIILGKVADIALKLQQGQAPEGILSWVLAETRTLLQTDRVLLYRVLKDETTVVAFESVGATCTPLPGQQFQDACFDATWVAHYQPGQTTPPADRNDGMLAPRFIEWLKRSQVQAHLAEPLVSRGKLWGVLMVQHCGSPREWQPLEIQYLQQVALHLGLVIQQVDRPTCNTTHHKAALAQPQQIERLRQERETYRAFVEHSPDIIERFDTQLRHLYVSPSLTRLTGLPTDAFLGKTCRELGLPKAMVHTWETAAQRVLATGEKQIIEFAIPTLDGDRWFEMAIVPEYTDHTLQSLLCLSRDITERKAISDALQISEEQRRLALDLTQLGSWDWHLLTGDLVWSEQTYALLGYAPGDPSHIDWRDLLPPEDLKAVESAIEQAQVEHTYFNCEYRVIHPDGNVHWLWARGRTLYDEAKRPVRMVGIVMNIDERKQLEIALQNSEERYRQIVETAAEGIWILDTNNATSFVNPYMANMLGYSESAMLGKSLFDFMDEEGKAIAARLLERRRQGIIEQHDFKFQHRNGSAVWTLVSTHPLLDEAGHYAGALGMLTNITDRKANELALEQQAQREQALNRVLQAIRQSLDLDTIFATATAETAHLLQSERVQIVQYLPLRKCWQIVASYHQAGLPDTVGLEIPEVDNPLSAQLKRGEVVRLANTDTLTDAINQQIAQTLPGAWLLLPIIHQGNVWGSLTVNTTQHTFPWSEEQVALVQMVTDQLAIAIQQANLYRQTQLELAERQRAEADLYQLNQALEERVQERTEALQKQAEKERVLRLITQRIHASFNLEKILETALTASRQTLLADRVALYRFNPDWSGNFIAESVAPGWVPLVGPNIQKVWEDTYLQKTQGGRYQHGETFAVNDIYTVGHQQCHLDLLVQFQAKAYAIAPIFVHDTLWGLLAAYQNTVPRQWQEADVELLRQIALRVAIAIQQAALYQTAQAQVQELERLDQVKDEFLSTVSHELRSPITNIKMATQMLEIQLTQAGVLDSAGTSPISRYFKILKEQSEREIQLINDLLDLARLDANTEPLTLTNLCLGVWVEQRAGTFSERMQQQQQQLQLEIPSDLELETDVSCLERILAELLHNACKYTPAGETIRITANPIEGAKDLLTPIRRQSVQTAVQICVSNSGVEIPPEERERIFDKFYRIPKNDPWKHGGTGLGLALVKKLTERLGGTIHVDSGDGQTTFVLTFGSGSIAAKESHP